MGTLLDATPHPPATPPPIPAAERHTVAYANMEQELLDNRVSHATCAAAQAPLSYVGQSVLLWKLGGGSSGSGMWRGDVCYWFSIVWERRPCHTSSPSTLVCVVGLLCFLLDCKWFEKLAKPLLYPPSVLDAIPPHPVPPLYKENANFIARHHFGLSHHHRESVKLRQEATKTRDKTDKEALVFFKACVVVICSQAPS